MTRPSDILPRQPRRYPLMQAIHEENAERVLEIVASRCVIDEITGCHLWSGVRNDNGYPQVGHPTVYVHRIVAWAEAGFPGTMKSFPNVHHTCAVRWCVRPDHLLPVTSFVNTIEAAARNGLLDRIRNLEAEVLRLDPGNALVTCWPPIIDEVQKVRVVTSLPYLSMGQRIRRKNQAEAYQDKLRENKRKRYDEVLKVRRLMARGSRKRDAIRAVGMSVATFDRWTRRFQDESEDAR